VSQPGSGNEILVFEIRQLAKLAEQFSVYVREMDSELSELQEQLEIIRQYQRFTSLHTDRPN
jgi:hypothetical protein